MLWSILIILVFLSGAGFTVFLLYSKVRSRKLLLDKNGSVLEKEKKIKEELLHNLSQSVLGLSTVESIEKVQAELAAVEESIRSEKGRLSITQAELEAVETRLRELEEIERELENSSLETSQELEMLRSQQREIEVRNQSLHQELEGSLFQLNLLLDQLAGSAESVSKLSAAKAELTNGEQRVKQIEEQIANVNLQYAALKRAYDALDIEYAQLYEKQSAVS